MANKALPEQSVLLQLLRYEPETGKLFWRERGVEWFPAKTPNRSRSLCALWNARYANTEAFTAILGGYRTGSVFGTNYKSHRVIWKMVHGTDPDTIDHIDGDRLNNLDGNFRSISAAENAKNRCRPTNNKSGMIGVYRWEHRSCVYWAVSTPQKKSDTYFHCIGQAIKARRAAEQEHNFHPNHGRSA